MIYGMVNIEKLVRVINFVWGRTLTPDPSIVDHNKYNLNLMGEHLCVSVRFRHQLQLQNIFDQT